MRRVWWKNKWLWGGTAFIVLLVIFIIGVEIKFWPSWTGFGADVEKSITVEKRPDGTITKLTEVSRQQQEKTLWDLLGLLGVPLVLTGLGFWYQSLQQRRIDEQTKEEVLQAYFDRVSALLVDKNLIATTKQPKGQHDQVKVATDVIQAWTRAVLRQLEKDSKRKIDVLLFLINTEVLSCLRLDVSQFHLKDLNLKEINFRKTNLEGIDLSGIDLCGANFEGVTLRNANLSGAILVGAKFFSFHSSLEFDIDFPPSHERLIYFGTDLRGVRLRGANLQNADLRFVDLQGADLREATLKDATLTGMSEEWDDFFCQHRAFEVPANLSQTKLSGVSLEKLDLSSVAFRRADLSDADLRGANLNNADLRGANLKGAKLEGANLEGTLLEGAIMPDGSVRTSNQADLEF